jgi:hypothetical protein
MTGLGRYNAPSMQSHPEGLTMAKLTHFLRTGGNSKTTRTRYTEGKPSKDAQIARDEFSEHRKGVKKGEREHKLTPLQRRMQSGGPT